MGIDMDLRIELRVKSGGYSKTTVVEAEGETIDVLLVRFRDALTQTQQLFASKHDEITDKIRDFKLPEIVQPSRDEDAESAKAG